MSVVGYVARNHPQQLAARGALATVDDRETHRDLFDPLNARFHFTVDVAAAKHNAKVRRWYSAELDGLKQSWDGEVVWCNPPFSNIRPWVEKAWATMELADPRTTIVMLVPANRTEQAWWQDLVEPHRDRGGSGLRTEFLRGRHRFIQAGRTAVGPNERPPFGCCLLIWTGAS